MGDVMRGYDEWATGGRYSKAPLLVTCGTCEETTSVLAETEYGATNWSPEECGSCGAPFEGNEKFEDDEPDMPDRWEDV